MTVKIVQLKQSTYDKYKNDMEDLALKRTEEIFDNTARQRGEWTWQTLYIIDTQTDKPVAQCFISWADVSINLITFVIEQIYVLPEYRGRGYSILLIKAAIGIAVRQSCDYVEVEFKDERLADKVCKKLNFTKVGNSPGMKVDHKIVNFTKCILILDKKTCKKYKYVVEVV